MYIYPPTYIALWNDDITETFLAMQMARMKFAFKTLNTQPSQETINATLEDLRESAKVDFSKEQLLDIMALFPIHRGKWVDYGWGDTEVSDLMMDVLALFFLGTHWPLGRDDVDITKFYARFHQAVKAFGYKVLE